MDSSFVTICKFINKNQNILDDFITKNQTDYKNLCMFVCEVIKQQEQLNLIIDSIYDLIPHDEQIILDILAKSYTKNINFISYYEMDKLFLMILIKNKIIHTSIKK